MPQSVAVAIVHGIARRREDFASGIIQQLRKRVARQLGAEGVSLLTFLLNRLPFMPL